MFKLKCGKYDLLCKTSRRSFAPSNRPHIPMMGQAPPLLTAILTNTSLEGAKDKQPMDAIV